MVEIGGEKKNFFIYKKYLHTKKIVYMNYSIKILIKLIYLKTYV
jgi:hypothetical protein